MAPGNHTVSYVSSDHFRALSVPLLAGRFFGDADIETADSIAIVNENVARTYFPGQNPIGQTGSVSGPRTIVGVVGDVRVYGPEQEIPYAFFVPSSRGKASSGTLVIRVTRNGATILPQVQAAIWAEFPDLAIPAIRTLEERFGAYIAERRFSMLLLSLFGVIGLTIAAVGIYGTMTYVVTQRTRDIGTRMALGAQRSTILRSVLRRAFMQSVIGIGVGLSLAWALATSVEKLLFQIQAHEVWLYATVVGVLSAVALIAAMVPAHRASRVDPLIALRLE